MRVELGPQSWTLREIGDVEWFMLIQLPEAADPSQSERGRKRIFPEITSSSEDSQIHQDWKEFVVPELEDQFDQRVKTVTEDLSKAEETEGADGPLHRLEVPLDHAETWYSVLNQARLILNEEHDITNTEQQLMYGDSAPTEIEERKWLILVQYRVYAAIQEFLLSQFTD
ncbi:MAG: DUF2017 family protein [Verrucomicrobiota bacterium]